jgi:hypothetical protein
MKSVSRLVAILVLTGACFGQTPTPTNGYIPDEKTAVRVAEAILSPIYGEGVIAGERPFHATLKDGVWTVNGSLPKPKNPQFIVMGGTAQICIDKRTGAILSYAHYK